MKTKISLIIIEISGEFDPFGLSNTRVLVDEDGKIPSKYISTKSVEGTIQELLYEYCNIDIRYAEPELSNFIHPEGASDCEAIYTITIPSGYISLKNGSLSYIENLEVEDYYEEQLGRIPRGMR
jgi:hypothetical protein